VIGLIAGLLVCVAVPFVENKLKLDDPVGAISVHCVNGLWGVISLGIFADGTYGDGLNGVKGGVAGLLYGDPSQFAAQLIAVLVLIVWGFGVSYIFFRVLDKFWGLRVSPEDELAGLDIPEMGVLAYPDQALTVSELDFYSEDNCEIKQLARFNWNKKSNMKPAAPAKAVSVGIDQAVPVELVSKPAVTVGSDVKITKIDIITKQSKFEALKIAMNKIGITGMTVTQVLGCGIQKGKPEYYRGVEVEMSLLPKVQVEIVVATVPVRKVIDTAKAILYTGHIGDGKIFVYDVENVIKVRTGEEGFDALQDTDE
jgi:Amt family ammonium transporter